MWKTCTGNFLRSLLLTAERVKFWIWWWRMIYAMQTLVYIYNVLPLNCVFNLCTTSLVQRFSFLTRCPTAQVLFARLPCYIQRDSTVHNCIQQSTHARCLLSLETIRRVRLLYKFRFVFDTLIQHRSFSFYIFLIENIAVFESDLFHSEVPKGFT